MLLTCLIDVEPSDRLSEIESHGRQATSKVEGLAVLISPVRDDKHLEKLRAEA